MARAHASRFPIPPALIRCLVAAATGLVVLLAPTPAAEVQWRCELSVDLVRLHCAAAPPPPAGTPGPGADSAAEATTSPSTPPITAEVNGTRFPLDPRRRWTVELWTPPTEAAFVEQLARATICYRTPRCEVQVDLRPMHAAAGRDAGSR